MSVTRYRIVLGVRLRANTLFTKLHKYSCFVYLYIVYYFPKISYLTYIILYASYISYNYDYREGGTT